MFRAPTTRNTEMLFEIAFFWKDQERPIVPVVWHRARIAILWCLTGSPQRVVHHYAWLTYYVAVCCRSSWQLPAVAMRAGFSVKWGPNVNPDYFWCLLRNSRSSLLNEFVPPILQPTICSSPGDAQQSTLENSHWNAQSRSWEILSQPRWRRPRRTKRVSLELGF